MPSNQTCLARHVAPPLSLFSAHTGHRTQDRHRTDTHPSFPLLSSQLKQALKDAKPPPDMDMKGLASPESEHSAGE